MTRSKFLRMMADTPAGMRPVVKLTKQYPGKFLPAKWKKKGTEYWVCGEDSFSHVASLHIRYPDLIAHYVGFSRKYFDFFEYAPAPSIVPFFTAGLNA